MVELLDRLSPQEGARPSLIDGVTLIRATRSSARTAVLYEPCIVIVAQGRKRFHLPERIITYDAERYLVLTVPVPADCETEALYNEPFLGVAVRINLAALGDLVMKMGPTRTPKRAQGTDAFIGTPLMNDLLSEATIRLLECLASPIEARVLGPELIRELTFRVLCGEEGGNLLNLLLANHNRSRIHRILHRMHVDYTSALDVPSLAREAGMSVSALHEHFKAVTATSPVQYLKTIRLHKARTLMVQDALRASVAAERVGYDSPSQFSREFKRLFGAPPADEAERVRSLFGFTNEAQRDVHVLAGAPLGAEGV